MDLEFNSLEDAPELVRDSLIERNGKFVHKEFARLIDEKKGVLDKLHSQQSELDGFKTKMTEYEKGESEREARIRAETEERLRKEGKHDELLKIEQEKFSNERKSLLQQLEEANNKFNELQTSVTDKSRAELAIKIATQYAPKNMIEPVAELLKSKRTKVTESGEVVFTNASGEAMDIKDMASVYNNLKSDPYFSAFEAAPGSRGGMGAGGGYDSSSSTVTRAQWDSMTPQQQSKAMKDGKRIVD